MPVFDKIAIIGLGLIGGSIALAAKKNNIAKHISAYNKTKSVLDEALAAGVIDSASQDLAEVVDGSDIVIICTPVATYVKIVDEMKHLISSKTILTDAGSVKVKVTDDVYSSLSSETQPYFVPSHPIAGSEKSGLSAAKADLYEGKKVILTPTDITNKKAAAKVAQLWSEIGADIFTMSPQQHDDTYALTSHIIHLLSFAYVHLIASEKIEACDSFNHFIRLAGSSPKMWLDIFLYNKKAILAGLEKFYSFENLVSITNDDIQAAKSERMNLGGENIPLTSEGREVYADILPKIIACAATGSIKGKEQHIGSGFLSFTECLLGAGEIETSNFKNQLQNFDIQLKKAVNLIKKEDGEAIISYIEESNSIFDEKK